jgi:hypothetical protein
MPSKYTRDVHPHVTAGKIWQEDGWGVDEAHSANAAIGGEKSSGRQLPPNARTCLEVDSSFTLLRWSNATGAISRRAACEPCKRLAGKRDTCRATDFSWRREHEEAAGQHHPMA